jgi:hypothetical protein
MNWLVLSYFLSLGTLSQYGQFIAPIDPGRISSPATGSFRTDPGTFQSTLGIEAQMLDNFLFIGGSVETWETFNGGFYPFESLYEFSAGLRWSGLELGYRHECDHPTIDNMSLPGQGFGFTKDEFYLSYTGKINIF